MYMYAHNKYNLTSNHVYNKQLTLSAPARGRLDAGERQPAKPRTKAAAARGVRE